MHITNIITVLGLATAASAIDIRLNSGSQCGGTWLQCGGINPNTCCGVPSGSFGSIWFNYIPREWSLELRGYNGRRCSRRVSTAAVGNVVTHCFLGNAYTGGGYGFINRKRDVESSSRECQAPDTLGLPDGTTYSLKDLKEDQINLILENLENITTAADIPGGVECIMRLD